MHDPEMFDTRHLSKRSKRKHAVRRGKPVPWRRMLLTSSQISIILSVGIILFSTAALFMSGVVIQKRTLEEIRIGIKTPKPTAKVYLPDRFRQTTTELEDGTIVIVDDKNPIPPKQKKEVHIEVKRTEEPPPNEPAKAAESPLQKEQTVPKEEEEGKVEPRTEMERNILKQLEANMEHPDPRATDRRPLTRAERRRLIKEEIQRLSHVEGPAYQRRLY